MVEKEETFQRHVPKKEGKPLRHYLLLIGISILFLVPFTFLYVGIMGSLDSTMDSAYKNNKTVTYQPPSCFIEKEQLSQCLISLNKLIGGLQEQKIEPETIKPKKVDRDVELCQNIIGGVFYNYNTTECKDGGKQNTPLKCCRTKYAETICTKDENTNKKGYTEIGCLQ